MNEQRIFCVVCIIMNRFRTKKDFATNMNIIMSVNLSISKNMIHMSENMEKMDDNLEKLKQNLEHMEEMYDMIFRKVNRLIP